MNLNHKLSALFTDFLIIHFETATSEIQVKTALFSGLGPAQPGGMLTK
jgi:hypothetical protein